MVKLGLRLSPVSGAVCSANTSSSLSNWWLDADSGTPEDARSLARRHLGQINTRIQQVLQTAQGRLDDYSLAHLEESQVRVTKALDAGFQMDKR